jgi:hypothetical protein
MTADGATPEVSSKPARAGLVLGARIFGGLAAGP